MDNDSMVHPTGNLLPFLLVVDSILLVHWDRLQSWGLRRIWMKELSQNFVAGPNNQ